jgi:hypothetical protein
VPPLTALISVTLSVAAVKTSVTVCAIFYSPFNFNSTSCVESSWIAFTIALVLIAASATSLSVRVLHPTSHSIKSISYICVII